uniref:Uncharacterized protein n=1 Tax=Cannabis sativa TaxID=3483 RepID=A0A803QVC7_CANSA
MLSQLAQAIEKQKGKLVVKEAPRAVSERDDKLLAEHMAKLGQDNEEVGGDDESEEEEDTGMGRLISRLLALLSEEKKKSLALKEILTLIFDQFLVVLFCI